MKKEEIIGEAKLDEFRGKIPPWLRNLFKPAKPGSKVDDWVPVPKRPSDKHIWDKAKGKWVLPEPKVVPKPKPKPKPEIEAPTGPRIVPPRVDPKVEPPLITPKVKPQPKPQPKPEPKPQPKPEPKPQPKPEPKPKVKPDVDPVVQPPKIKTQPATKTATKTVTQVKPFAKPAIPKRGTPTAVKRNTTPPPKGKVTVKTPVPYKPPILPSATTSTAKQEMPLLRSRLKTQSRSLGRGVLQYGGPDRGVIREQVNTRQQYADLALKYAKLYDVPPELALHVLNRETGIYDADIAATIVSPKGAVGVMQIKPSTGKDLGLSPKDLQNPRKNIEAGVRYLAQQYNKYQNPVHALTAYNWGPGNTDKWLAKGGKGKIPKATRDYIYGSKQLRWAPYKGSNIQTQIQSYLGKDAENYLAKINNPPALKQLPTAPKADPRKLNPDQMTLDVKQGFDTVAQKTRDLAKKGYDVAVPVVKNVLKTTAPDVYQAGVDVVDTVKQKWKDFKGSVTNEEAPPGDKYERMVKHIKKGYKKDGKLTDQEKGIAYATAWKLYNQSKKKKS